MGLFWHFLVTLMGHNEDMHYSVIEKGIDSFVKFLNEKDVFAPENHNDLNEMICFINLKKLTSTDERIIHKCRDLLEMLAGNDSIHLPEHQDMRRWIVDSDNDLLESLVLNNENWVLERLDNGDRICPRCAQLLNVYKTEDNGCCFYSVPSISINQQWIKIEARHRDVCVICAYTEPTYYLYGVGWVPNNLFNNPSVNKLRLSFEGENA